MYMGERQHWSGRMEVAPTTPYTLHASFHVFNSKNSPYTYLGLWPKKILFTKTCHLVPT